MSGRYAPYPNYRDSSNPWFGKIPDHWAVVKCGHRYEVLLGKMLDGSRVTGANSGCYLRNVDVQWDRINEEDLPTMDFAPSEQERYSVRNGDLLVCEGGEVGRSAIWNKDYPCYYQKALHRLRRKTPSQDSIRFMFYNFALAVNQERFISGSGKATIAHLPAEALRQYRFPYPPLEEQAQIAKFLDDETAKIDALIEKQQQLIVLLKEKRQAVISHAVTKGLNPDAPMRDSGVEWLGKVPKHWRVLKGAWLGTLFGSESVPEDHIVPEGPLLFIKVSSLSTDEFPLAERSFFVSRERWQFVKPRRDFIVFPKRGAAIFTNKVNIVNEDAIIDPNLMGWEPNVKVNAEYLAHLLKLRGLQDIADVSTVPQINNKHIAPMMFPVPPVSEQNAIIEALKHRLVQLRQLQEKANRQIDLLQERRTALISAAVTGKIDVRGWKPPA